MPPRTDRLRATPLADAGAGDRVGRAGGGDAAVAVGSVEGLRPGVELAGGFFVAADMATAVKWYWDVVLVMGEECCCS